MKHITIQQLLRFFFVAFFIITLFLTIKHVFILIYPLFIALGLTLFFHPIVLFIEARLKIPKLLITIITISFSFIIFLVASLWLLSELIQGIIFFIDFIPTYFTAFISFVERLSDQYFLPLYDSFFTSNQQILFKQPLSQLMNQMQNNFILLLEGIVKKVLSFLAKFPYSLALSLFIMIATILITKDWPLLQSRVRNFIPQTINNKITVIFNHFKFLLFNYFKAQLIIVVVTACIVLIGLLFLKVDHALTITFFIALVDILPVIGTGVIFVPWIIFLFLYGNFPLTIGITSLYILVIVVRQIIEPKIISQHLGVRPLTALLCLFFGVQLWGIGGLIVAPLLLIFGQALVVAEVFSALWNFIKGANVD